MRQDPLSYLATELDSLREQGLYRPLRVLDSPQAAQATFDAVMIVPEPFTIAYGMNRLTDTLVVDIGAGTIDLCPIHGTCPDAEEQVTLPIGGDFVDEHFYNRLKAAHPTAQLSHNMVREIKEKYGFVNDVNEKVIVPKFSPTSPPADTCWHVLLPAQSWPP